MVTRRAARGHRWGAPFAWRASSWFMLATVLLQLSGYFLPSLDLEQLRWLSVTESVSLSTDSEFDEKSGEAGFCPDQNSKPQTRETEPRARVRALPSIAGRSAGRQGGAGAPPLRRGPRVRGPAVLPHGPQGHPSRSASIRCPSPHVRGSASPESSPQFASNPVVPIRRTAAALALFGLSSSRSL